jgi:hypothetical protein
VSKNEAAAIGDALTAIANAITPRAALRGRDAAGGAVESLTEAAMGITAGLVQIAEALNNVADAIRARGGSP